MKTTIKLTSFLLSFLLSLAPALVQQPRQQESVPKPQTIPDLHERITSLLDQPKFKSARWGVRIITTGGSVVFERDADKTFMPASNMKLYTSAAALDLFGPEYKIKTSVYATKTIKGGLLKGDLILYGRGDPNLSPRFDPLNKDKYSELKPADKITAIELLADRIKARGIKIISGNLIGDDSFFAGDLLGPGWAWDDAQFYYGAEISALSVNDNSVTFNVTPAWRAGNRPDIEVQPINSYVKIINNAKTVESGPTRIGVHRPLNSNTVEFFGTIPRKAQNFEIEIAVHDPASFSATLLREALVRRGVRVNGRVQRMDYLKRMDNPFDETKLIEVAGVESQPMSEMLKVVNKQSQNLHTELMLRHLGTKHYEAGVLNDYGRPKSSAVLGNEMRNQFLVKAGIDSQLLGLRDGSGLARQNLVTPHSTSRLLEFMLAHPNYAAFRETLVIAGVDGTLERRMRGTIAMNNFRGKTGTLTYANALSGYVTTKGGHEVIFSMMGNNYIGAGRDVTGVLDQICVMLAEYDGGF